MVCRRETKKEITASFPKDFEVEVLVRHSVAYQIEVHEVREKEAPELENEDFLKSLQIKSVDELREKVTEQLKIRKEQENEN